MWLSGWNRRKAKTINGTVAGVQYNYQKKLTFYTGSGTDTEDSIYLGFKVRDDFGDLRFTKADGETLLNYWIESYIPGVSAVVWVQIDYIPVSPKNINIYIYYDNPAAVSASNGKNTFDFFDDFSGDLSKWDKVGSPAIVNGKELKITGDGGWNTQAVKTVNTFTKPIIFEWTERLNQTNTEAMSGYIAGYMVDGTRAALYGGAAANVRALDVHGSTYGSTPQTTDSENWKLVLLSDGSVALYKSQSLIGNMTGYTDNNLKFVLAVQSNGKIVYYDNVRVRRPVSPEPTWGSTGTEEQVASASFITSPIGADIIIDGQNTGYKAPNTITVAVGTHSYTLHLACYEDFTGQFTITTVGQVITIDKNLRLNTGSIYANSTPAGAAIWLDGVQQSPPTPATLTCVPEGQRTVILTLAGYQYYKKSMNLVAGTTIGVDGVMFLIGPSGTGSVAIYTTPDGAEIFIDGVDQNKVTPKVVTGISAGIHTVRVEKSGYLPSSMDVTIEENVTTEISMTLSAVTEVGSALFSSTPLGAEIFIDGVDQNNVTPKTITGIPAGSHAVKLTLSGYNDWTGTVDIVADQTASVTAALVPGEGCIDFSSDPAGARIIIDGVDSGQVTPSLICGLSLGQHTYTLMLAGYQDTTGTVSLAAGQGTTVTAIPAPAPAKGIGAGTLLGLSVVGATVVGAVIFATREKKETAYTPPQRR